MPFYAFTCQACGEQFDLQAHMDELDRLDKQPPACPKCGKAETKRQITTFISKPASTFG
jgi:putative FmdB family regulatory protein